MTEPADPARAPLRPGLWGVLATPFHGSDLAVDVESLRREVGHYLAVPADGLSCSGSSARAPRSTPRSGHSSYAR